MQTMNKWTGEIISGEDALIQKIQDVLSTRIGTRLHPARDYGSRLPDLIDKPMIGISAEIAIATQEALKTWVPEVTITKVTLSTVDSSQSAKAALNLVGYITETGKSLALDNILL